MSSVLVDGESEHGERSLPATAAASRPERSSSRPSCAAASSLRTTCSTSVEIGAPRLLAVRNQKRGNPWGSRGVAGSGRAELRAMRPSGAMISPRTSGLPRPLPRRARDLVDEGDLGREELLAAYLIDSAVSIAVNTIGVSNQIRAPIELRSPVARAAASRPNHPRCRAAEERRSPIPPRRGTSGFETSPKAPSGRTLRQDLPDLAAVPTGTVDFVTDHGIAVARGRSPLGGAEYVAQIRRGHASLCAKAYQLR